MGGTLNHLTRKIDRAIQEFGPNMGFTLMIYPQDAEAAIAHYVSNGKREDVVKMLRGFADDLEEKS